jgi:iron complex outermembrane receptor protein
VFTEAALAAARSLHFRPATRGSSPVPATTRVLFHFAPPLPDGEEPHVEIVVHGPDPDRESVRARTTLDGRDLERAAGDDLAQTVSKVPGVRVAEGTADAAKPIIRGQAERRLLVLNDGIRHESQKWGPDHGTEVDPFAAGEVSVVRGAAGARYGPDAIGGVLLVQPPPLRSEPGVGGKALASFDSNGTRPYGALRLDAVPEALPGLAVRLEGNAAKGASKRAPDYVLGNTASETLNGGASIGYSWSHGSVRATWHRYALRAGVFYGVASESPDAFRDQLAADRPVSADLWTADFSIDRPYQQVTHDVASLHGTLFGDLGTLTGVYAYQHNHRQEFEQVRGDVDTPQYDFTLRTHSADLAWHHPEAHLSFGHLSGGVGLQGVLQENVYQGYSLLPNYRGFAGGVFAFERMALARVDLEAGLRHDRLARTAFIGPDDFEMHQRRGNLAPGQCTQVDTVGRCPAAYDSTSVSAGAVVHLVPDTFDLKLDLSTASRFPNVDELYLVGAAPSFPVFGVGDPGLGPETARGGSFTGGLRTMAVETELSGYAYRIDDYVYFAPERTPSGGLAYEVTIKGTWPRYGYRPIDASLFGADGSLSVAPYEVVGLDVRGSLVRMAEAGTGEQLVGTPADQLHLEPVLRPGPVGPFHEHRVTVPVDLVGRQSRVDPDVDFAPAPDGYVLLGLTAESAIDVGRREVRFGAAAHNLLNTAYRDYTSLLRYYADQPGRNVRVWFGMDI